MADPKPPATPPRLLANPVVAELLGIAERLRAVMVADGPNATDATAIDYRQNWGSPRIYVPAFTSSIRT